jgi:outer membrane cobalamin receptor
VVLEAGRASEQNIELHRHPNALTEVRIEGRMLKVPARFEDVYARAAHEHGTFFTRQDIDKLNPYDVQSLLSLVPTVYPNDRGVTFQRCQTGLSMGQTDKVQVYIDGTRMTALPGTSVSEALKLVIPRDIEAMEVYTGVARIPAEFRNDACAVIAIWTKSY